MRSSRNCELRIADCGSFNPKSPPKADPPPADKIRNPQCLHRGQSVLEYAILLGVAVAVIIAGQIYFKRGLQGRWKDASDQIGEQFTAREAHSIETRQLSSREEVTGTPAQLDAKSWSQSTIAAAMPAADMKGDIKAIGDYTGHETTSKDFVESTVEQALGKHATFKSGTLSDIKLFDEDSQ